MARVLVAEDEVLIRADVVETLELAGHSVVGEARDGEQAVELTRELEPDLVIMDVKMPRLDGLTAAREISDAGGPGVLVLTAFSDSHLTGVAAEAGVVGYLVKPFEPAQLLAAVDVALARSREREGLRDTVEDLQIKLADRKVIERAKGRLMAQSGVTEEEAFAWLRRTAMNHQMRLAEVARRVLAASEPPAS